MWRKPVFWLPALLIAVIGVSLLPWSPPVEAQGTTLRGPRPVEWKDFLGVNAQFQYFPQPVYEKQMQRLDELGLEGFTQEQTSASEQFIPPFDLTGVEKC